MAGRKVFLVEFAFVVDDRCALPGEADQSSPPAGPAGSRIALGSLSVRAGPRFTSSTCRSIAEELMRSAREKAVGVRVVYWRRRS